MVNNVLYLPYPSLDAGRLYELHKAVNPIEISIDQRELIRFPTVYNVTLLLRKISEENFSNRKDIPFVFAILSDTRSSRTVHANIYSAFA